MSHEVGPDARHRYAVIGAGPAGTTVAWRLAEAGEDVVLIEAGSGPPFPAALAGADMVAASGDERFLWADRAVGPDRLTRAYPQGRALGGGGAVNGMLLSPGDRADYDRWQDRHGCVGWGADDMAPWIERALDGVATSTAEPGPLTARFEAAANAEGHSTGGTTLDPDRAGSLVAVSACSRGRRSFPHERFGSAPSPTLRLGAAVDRIERAPSGATIVLSDGTLVGAEQVVVSAGAIRTPRLLVRSGLIDPSIGVPLQDHPSFAFAVRWSGPAPDGDRVVSRLLRWPSGFDPASGEALDLQAFVVDSVETPPAVGIGTDADGDGADRSGADGTRLGVVVVGLTAVASVGSVGTDGEPVDPGSLADVGDRDRLRRGVRHVAGLLRTMRADGAVIDVYLDDAGTAIDRLWDMADDELDRLLTANPGPYAHPACSVPLAPVAPGRATGPRRSRAVVDSRPGAMGTLPGSDPAGPSVTVVDASILPDLVGGGLQLPVTAVAERVAADLLAR